MPRIRTAVAVKRHYDHAARHSRELEAEVLRRTSELARSRRETTQFLARLVELRGDDDGPHVLRVGRYARLIALERGMMGDQLDLLEQAAQLHDVGKVAIPDAILAQRDKLTPEQYEIAQRYGDAEQRSCRCFSAQETKLYREHTVLGAQLMGSMKSPILRVAAKVARGHHEHWDGSGYPSGLKGEAIPIEARIVAVADMFDTLSSPHHGRAAFDPNTCLQIIADLRGRWFDPEIVDAMLACGKSLAATRTPFDGVRD